MAKRPILLFDVMDTIVYDPYRREIPEFFDLDLDELVELKHPTAWQEFERNDIDEATFFDKYFGDDHEFDGEELRGHIREAYRFVDGMETLLGDLTRRGCEIHALSNYPVWYRMIEDKLALSRFLDWSFVSCKTGLRKPNPEVFEFALGQLGAEREACTFIDDRSVNCRAAEDLGISAIHFDNAEKLSDELSAIIP